MIAEDAVIPTVPDVPAGEVHVLSPRGLLAVWFVLAVLTAATVGAATVDLGAANLWIALGIASAKAILVLLIFMHLLYDRPFHALIFVGAIVVVALFLGLTLLDTLEYRVDRIPGYAPGLPR